MAIEALKTARRDGGALRYLDEGSGEPALLFVHGWCCDHTYWRPQISEFSRRHRVVAVDLRGHGASDKPDEEYTISGYVDDLAWLFGSIGLQRPVAIGHSMGGVIVANLVRKHPALARAAVFVDSLLMPLGPDFQPLRQQVSEGLRSPQYQQVASQFIGQYLFREESPSSLRDEVIAGMTVTPQRVMYSSIENMFEDENLQAGALPVPALFVRAATLPVTEEQLREAQPGMEVRTLDCAHFVQLEKAEEFNAILSEILEEGLVG